MLYKFADDQGTYLAAQITYYGFAVLFPLLLLATFLGYALHGNQHLQRQVLDSALAQFPVIGDQITANVTPSTAASPTWSSACCAASTAAWASSRPSRPR